MVEHKVTRVGRGHRDLRARRQGRARLGRSAIDQRARGSAAGGDGRRRLVSARALRPSVQRPIAGRSQIPLDADGTPYEYRNVDPSNPGADGRAQGVVAARASSRCWSTMARWSPRRPASSSISQAHHPGPNVWIPATAKRAGGCASSTASSTFISRATCSRRSTTRIWPDGEGLARGDAGSQRRCASPMTGWKRTCPTANGPRATRFTLADCAAAPALFYADWIERDRRRDAAAARLIARGCWPTQRSPRSVEGARPYRAYFPLGAPDRD